MQKPENPMRRLFGYLKPYYGKLNYAISSSVANKVLDLMPPLLVGWVIDTVSGQPPAWIEGIPGLDGPWPRAIFLALLAVLIFGFESLFEWMFQSGFMRLAQRVQHDLRMDTYAALQRREMAFFESNRTGDTMAIMNDDVNQLERFLNTGFNDIVQLIVLFIFSGIILFAVSWQLALIGMIPIPLILLGSFWYQKRIEPRYGDIRSEVGKLSSRLENNISGISVIKSFTAEKFEQERVAENSNAYRKANFSAIKLNALYIPLIRMFVALGFGGVLLVGSYWVLTGNGMLSVGNLVLFSMMIQRLLWPITRLGRTLDEYARGRASSSRIFGLLDEAPAILESPDPKELERAEGRISFDDVHFSYREGMPVLNGLNLEVKAGETIGIAGTTGSGKSTLIKLLLRFYDPGSGAVRMDGHSLGDLRLRDVRRNIALVSQEVYLFHGTIRDNIAYGTECTLEEVEKASAAAQFHDFVLTLPEGYDTMVGERGLKLSGGQRQRLSIARALLKNAPILILDEATSSVDTETERDIQQNLDQYSAGRTALVVAHRLSTIRNADRIVVLDKGKLVENGTHEELLAKQGIYADLWNVQTGGE